MRPLIWKTLAVAFGIAGISWLIHVVTSGHSRPGAGTFVDVAFAFLAAAIAWRGGSAACSVPSRRYLRGCFLVAISTVGLLAIFAYGYSNLVKLAVYEGFLFKIVLACSLAAWLFALGLRGIGLTSRGYAFEHAFLEPGSDGARRLRREWAGRLGLWICGFACAAGLVPMMFAVLPLVDIGSKKLMTLQIVAIEQSARPFFPSLTSPHGLDPMLAMRLVQAKLVATPVAVAALAALSCRAVFMRERDGVAIPRTFLHLTLWGPALLAFVAFAFAPTIPAVFPLEPVAGVVAVPFVLASGFVIRKILRVRRERGEASDRDDPPAPAPEPEPEHSRDG